MTITITKLVLLGWLLILVGCSPSTDVNTIKKSPDHNSPVFNLYEIPITEHGYSLLKSQVIRSEYALDTLIEKINKQSYWNNKAAFIASLRKTPIDFSQYALVLFFHDEASSMVSLSLGKPEWNPTENSIYVPLYNDAEKDAFLTTDMVYYGYAFVVDNRLSIAELRSMQKSESERVIVNHHYSRYSPWLKQASQSTSNTCC